MMMMMFEYVQSIITTFAGGGYLTGNYGDGVAATSAQLNLPTGVAMDISGNVYIADVGNYKIRKVNSAGIITTFAGTGAGGSSGDGGAATSAQLTISTMYGSPSGVATDSSGNVYFADSGNNKIRMVNNAGIITTFAGTGGRGSTGDGGAATSAQLYLPSGVAADNRGNVYFADVSNHKIRFVNSAGIITTFAGTGTAGSTGDGGAATSAQLYSPADVTIDISGNFYIADTGNGKIRMVTSTGIITTFAGTGLAGSNGDGGAATSAQLYGAYSVAVDSSGTVYIADYFNCNVRKVSSNGIITTFAGNERFTYTSSGDGGAAKNADLSYPYGVAVDKSDNVYIAETDGQRIRVVKRVCPAGSYMSGSTCLLCAAGTYNPTIGTASACLTCPVNYFSQSNATQCTTTPSTSYAPGSPTPSPYSSASAGSPTVIPTPVSVLTWPHSVVQCTQVLINVNIVLQCAFSIVYRAGVTISLVHVLGRLVFLLI